MVSFLSIDLEGHSPFPFLPKAVLLVGESPATEEPIGPLTVYDT